MRIQRSLRVLGLLGLIGLPAGHAAAQTFGVIGDFGLNTTQEGQVATMVNSWNPEFIVTVGDNNYPSGTMATMDDNIGKYYHNYIGNYIGSYGSGAVTNKFFPALGNHDWGNVANNPTGADPHKAYFTLPGNERYYDFVKGSVHFFILDSDANEPDSVSSHKTQGQWLKTGLANSTSPFKVVFEHHAAYSSSSNHGSHSYMQWPFKQWGATSVLAGHDHNYERSVINGLPYFVNGLGGHTSLYGFTTPIAGSQVRYNGMQGAQRITASPTQMTFEFLSMDGVVRDTYTQPKPIPPQTVTKTFQDDLVQNGITYDDTQDTHIQSANTAAQAGQDAKVVVDNSPSTQGLIRFDNIFGNAANQIPAGATIYYANLRVVTGETANDNGGDEIRLYRMTTTWSETSTWNSMGGGVDVGTETLAAIEGFVDPTLLGVAMNFDVTTALQAWATNPSSNFGWALIGTGTDGWRWASSEFGTFSERPALEISYVVPEPASLTMILVTALAGVRRRRFSRRGLAASSRFKSPRGRGG